MIVRENINFHRGLEPDEGLGIGKHREIKLLNPTKKDVKNLPDGYYNLDTGNYHLVFIKKEQGLNILRCGKNL